MRLDATLAEVVAGTTEPAVGAIRLAWWREALEKLDTEPAPAEPRLNALAAQVLPRGVSGAMLADIEDGYTALLAPETDVHRIGEAGAQMFRCIAALLGEDDPAIGAAGRLTMLARVRGLSPADLKPAALEQMRTLSRHRFARPLRPLTLLARLAARDTMRGAPEPEGTPGRAIAMLSHRLTGIVTGTN